MPHGRVAERLAVRDEVMQCIRCASQCFVRGVPLAKRRLCAAWMQQPACRACDFAEDVPALVAVYGSSSPCVSFALTRIESRLCYLVGTTSGNTGHLRKRGQSTGGSACSHGHQEREDRAATQFGTIHLNPLAALHDRCRSIFSVCDCTKRPFAGCFCGRLATRCRTIPVNHPLAKTPPFDLARRTNVQADSVS